MSEQGETGPAIGKRSFDVMHDVLADHLARLIPVDRIRDEFTRRFLLDDEQIEARRAELRAQTRRAGAASQNRHNGEGGDQ